MTGYLAHDLGRKDKLVKMDMVDLLPDDILHFRWEEELRLFGVVRLPVLSGRKEEYMHVVDVINDVALVRRGRLGSVAHSMTEGLSASIIRRNG